MYEYVNISRILLEYLSVSTLDKYIQQQRFCLLRQEI